MAQENANTTKQDGQASAKANNDAGIAKSEPQAGKAAPVAKRRRGRPVGSTKKKIAAKKLTAAKGNPVRNAEKSVEKIARKARKAKQRARENVNQTQSQNAQDRKENTMRNEQYFQNFTQEAANANKEYVEAFVRSGTQLFRGLEEYSRTVMSMSEDASRKSAEAMKALMACRTLNEFTEAQTKLAQQGFDDLVKNTSRLTEMGIRCATEAAQPLNEQVNRTMRRANTKTAA